MKPGFGFSMAAAQPVQPASAQAQGFGFGVARPNMPSMVKKPGKAATSQPNRRSRRRPRKPRVKNSLASYIYKVLKQVHPDTGISRQAMDIVNSFCWDAARRIVAEAHVLSEANGKSTISSREIQTGVRLVLPGELAKHAVSEGTKAVTKFVSSEYSGPKQTQPPAGRGSKPAPKPRAMSKSMRAGLQFPVGRIHSWLKTRFPGKRVGKGAPVYLSAVMEYLSAEVLELAGNAARDNKKMRIIPRHITLAIRNDEELNKLTKDAIIPYGGVLPNIHCCLLPKKY